MEQRENNTNCEWCNMTYPKGCYQYWFVEVFGEVHIICDDCKKRLRGMKLLKGLKDERRRN